MSVVLSLLPEAGQIEDGAKMTSEVTKDSLFELPTRHQVEITRILHSAPN